MRLLDHWHILAANIAVLMLGLLIRRWDRGMQLGYIGVALIVLPIAFAYLSGRMSIEESVGPLLGIILLAADLRGKLPRKRNSNVLKR